MEVPSSSGIPCITIEEDDVELEIVVGNNTNIKTRDVAIKSEISNELSTKIQDIIVRLGLSNGPEKQKVFDELRTCFSQISQEEFASLLFRSLSITIKENNICSLCKTIFKNSYENITHVILVHNVSLKCSGIAKIENKKVASKISTQKIVPRSSDKFKRFLDTCNRAKTLSTRMNRYESLKRKYTVHLKSIQNKLVENMFDESKKRWTCINCKRSYKQHSALAKHLFVEHRLNLEFDSESEDKKIKLEKNNEDKKPADRLDKPNIEKSGVNTPSLATDIKSFAIYLAKSFPTTNLELLYELLKNLNYDTTMFEDVTKNQNNFAEFMENTITSSYIKHLVQDIGDSTFSIFIHQYTKRSRKFLLLVVKYFSNNTNRIITSFYRLKQVQSEIYAIQIIKVLNTDGLDIEKCVGFGLDIAYDNEDLSNSINVLKNIYSKIEINRCVSQSLKLVAEKACTQLPENLAIMIKEIYERYKSYDSCQLRDTEPKSHNYQWFAEIECIQFIVDKWLILKNDVSSVESCHTAYIFQNLFEVEDNRGYLCFIDRFLRPILELHDSFQTKLIDSIDVFRRIISILATFQVKQESKPLAYTNETATSLHDFVQCLVSELQNLVPKESSTLHRLSFSSIEPAQTTYQMQCLPVSNGEVIRIFDHVTEFINEMKDEIPIPAAEAFLIGRLQCDFSFLEI